VGVERAVTRWYLQRQSILAELAALEAQLATTQAQERQPGPGEAEIAQQIALVREKLRVLGPCPRPMMG
jgi:hypothetical protein